MSGRAGCGSTVYDEDCGRCTGTGCLTWGSASKKGQRRVSRRMGIISIWQDESVLPGQRTRIFGQEEQ